MPRCLDGGAGPAPRLSLASATLEQSRRSICDHNWSDVLAHLLPSPGLGVFDPCFPPAIDLQPLVPGLQAECAADLMLGGEPVAPLDWCTEPDRDPGLPCLRPSDDPEQCPYGRTAIVVDHGDVHLPPGSWADIRCARACP